MPEPVVTFLLLARMAVVGLIEGDWASAIAVGGEKFVEKIFGQMNFSSRNNVRQRIAAVEKSFEQTLDFRNLDPPRQRSLVELAVALFRFHPVTAAFTVACNYSPVQLTDRMLDSGSERIRVTLDSVDDQRERRALREIVSILHSHILNEPQTLTETELEFRRAQIHEFRTLYELISDLPDNIRRVQAAAMSNSIFQQDAPRRFDSDVYPDAILLSAEFEAVPLMHRETELADLEQWCERADPVAVRLYRAEGGVGKTRLMRHAAGQLRLRGWTAGFVNMADESLGQDHWSLLSESGRNAALILDYADTGENSDRLLTDLLGFAVALAGQTKAIRLRLILIVRRSTEEWFQRIKDRANDSIRGLLSGHRTNDVEVGLLSPEQRQSLFQAARQSFAVRLSLAPADVPDPDLSATHFGRPLFVLIAALQSIRDGNTTGSGMKKNSLMTWILDRHRAHWRRELKDSYLVNATAQAMALIILKGGLRASAEFELVRTFAPRLKGLDDISCDRIRALLARLYPGPLYVNPLTPDALADELTRSQIDEDKGMIAAMAILGVQRG
jgi:hypothetical protein